MKKFVFFGAILVLFSSFSLHKFYVSVTQINYVAEKKTIQITTRIFVDDLNNALGKKHKKNVYIGSVKETNEEVDWLKKYLETNFSLKINGKEKEVVFLDKEMEDDVLICYLVVKNVSKINSLEVKNMLLFDFLPEQQNIIHTQVSTQKKSALLTFDHPVELLKY